MSEKGYLEGHHMASMFNMMRENDLIWSFVVNNYLRGRDPMPFDLLYWNSDSTRLPAAMLLTYLRKVYVENGLTKPGHLVLDGTPIDIGAIKTPCYVLATNDDHIAPWVSSYPATQAFSGPVRFVSGRFRTHCRRNQSARRQQVRLLDQQEQSGHPGGLDRGRRIPRRLLVDRLGQVACAQGRAQGPRPAAG